MSDLPDGNDFFEEDAEIVDLDGEPFVVIGELEYESGTYLALVPYGEEDDGEDEIEFVILKEVEEDGEYFLATIDDEELYAKIGGMFLELFDEEDDGEGNA
jgi:uncharacterized protein YrzB (UPF0473 family)